MHQGSLCEERLKSVNHLLVNTFGKYIEIKVWCKNAPLVQKFASTDEERSAFTVFPHPATSHPANNLPSNQFTEAFRRDRVSRAQSGARKTVFRLVIFGATENILQDNFQNLKNKPLLKENRRRAGVSNKKNLLFAEEPNFMKNAPSDLEIEPEDFDSIFLWKVFWKLIKQENPLCFFLKVFLLGAGLVALILCIFLVGDLTSA